MSFLEANQKAADTYSRDEDVDDIARKLHEGSVFAENPHGVSWDDVDPIMRARRLQQAYDLKNLGYVQPINLFYAADHIELKQSPLDAAEEAKAD